MRKTHTPTSRAQDERRNTLQQNDFAYGVYNDVPSNEIPTRGVHRLINYTNKSSYLESRTGSRAWGDNITDPEVPVAAASIPNAVTGADAFVERLEAYTLTYTIQDEELDEIPLIVNLRGWYVSRDENGVQRNDKVIDVQRVNGVTALKVATGTDVTDVAGDVVVNISGPVFGLYYSKFHSRVIMHVGCSVYVSTNQYMTEWSQARFIGSPADGFTFCCAVSDSRSSIKELDGKIVILNKNGVFSLNCDNLPAYYLKANSDVPITRLTGIGEDPTNPEIPVDELSKYGRKRVYGYVRLTGDGYRDRLTDGVSVEWESGGVSANTNDRDYAVEWRVDEDAMIDATNNISNLQIEGNSQQHATHFSVYATRNIEEEFGIIAKGNNTEELIWEMDVPLTDVVRFNVTGEAVSGTFEFTSNSISSVWLGSTVYVNGGTYTIDEITETGGSLGGTAGSLIVGEYTMTMGIDYSDVGTVTGGSTVVVADSSVYNVGDKLYFTDGVIRCVLAIIDSVTFTLSGNVPNGVAYFTKADGRILQTTVNSTIRDYELTVRSEKLPMVGRFWEPVQNSDLGALLPGFIMFGRLGKQNIQYTQLTSGFEYLLGQYNPVYQFDVFDDTVRDITGFDGNFVVKCSSSTKSLNSTSYVSSGNPDVGRFVFVLSTVTTISDNIGVVGPWASIKIDGETTEWVVTSRMELRKFDGRSYGTNVMSRRLMNRLRKMSTEFSLGHHPYFGLVIWGVQ